jgi:ABC-type nitrate/sulfonate/bicarbonate transport system permease component
VSRGRSILARWLPPLLLLAALIGAWEIAAQTGFLTNVLNLSDFLVPAPSEVATSLWDNRQLLADNAWVTLREALAGFAIALVLGALTALALHLSAFLRRAVYPLVLISQTLPVVVVAPIFVVWFGFGIWPKVALVALWCYFPIAVAALGGLASAPEEQRRLMRTLGAGRARTLATLEAPSALPSLLSGAKIAAVIAIAGAVIAEWAGASEGLGYLILRDDANLQAERVFASAFVLCVMAIALFAVVSLLGRRFVWWESADAPPGHRGGS